MAQAIAPLFDFTTEAGRKDWQPAHDIASLTGGPDGMTITASGDDPYLHSPLTTVPSGKPLWLVLTLKCTQSGIGQLFFYTPPAYATEESSVRFPVAAGRAEVIRVALPPLPAEKCHFRFDPPGTKGSVCTVASLTLEPRVVLAEPAWPEPTEIPAATYADVRSDTLSVRLAVGMGAFEVRLAGEVVARGHNRPLLGYQASPSGPLRWLRPGETATASGVTGTSDLRAAFRDEDGGVWTWRQAFRAQPGGKIQVETTLACDTERYLVQFPAVALLAEARRQGLFAGIEYLDEPDRSSSEDDLTGTQAKRHVPDPHQHTLPLMALAFREAWLALSWEPGPAVAACFDSPNRRFGGAGHLLGLWFPGATRAPGRFLPDSGVRLTANRALRCVATLSGGAGSSVVPAVALWVKDHPLPAPPRLPVDPLRLATVGFLESGCAEKGLFRHALPGDFKPQPAADAALLLTHLRQRGPAEQARARLPRGDTGGIGHVRTLGPALAFGEAAALLAGAARQAEQLLARFAADGTVPYAPGKVDYGRTHFEKTANGLVAPLLYEALQAASLSGQAALVGAALGRLRQLHERWHDTVPRGAQTWEVPLHTPDILAAAHLVKLFVLGYELTGEAALREAARYWAWTGVPFVYLVPPTSSPDAVGLYATIAVLGATGWVAPNWIGLPVQWCGLVYADALLDLAVHEPTGPWKRLAEGICASAVQQSFPIGSDRVRQGLLPDSFHLLAALRNDPAINPATLLVPWLRTRERPLYARGMLTPGTLVHAPGLVRVLGPRAARIETVLEDPYSIVVTGLPREPQQFKGKVKKVGYNSGVLLLEATGTVAIEL